MVAVAGAADAGIADIVGAAVVEGRRLAAVAACTVRADGVATAAAAAGTLCCQLPCQMKSYAVDAVSYAVSLAAVAASGAVAAVVVAGAGAAAVVVAGAVNRRNVAMGRR